ncbi:MAG: neutral zinc metallopeptidase [Gemmataceae bacterium]|nr:neutral zinc metallopeptidase [Gemmataceae bacterium]
MQWEGGAESSNVEDRRGRGGGVALAGGGAVGLLALVIYLFTGVNIGGPQGPGGGGPGVEQGQGEAPPANDRTKRFVATVLNFTEEVWKDEFNNRANGYGKRYAEPKLVLFSNAVQTGCGNAPSAVGPFYCPADETVYLDPTFFEELERKLGGSKAEFSQAYVIAHEVGHHVQNQLGYSRRVDEHRGKRDEKQFSVRLELQADYLAGVWANKGQKKFNFIEPGDVESAITSAKAIGDDRIQKRSRGWVSPEGFTHGTSAQRVKYFSEGLKTGDARKERLERFFTAEYDPRRGELVD